MTKHYCDRCGKELDSEDAKYPICIMPKELCVACATEYDATKKAVQTYHDEMWEAYWKKPRMIQIKLERRESNESNH